MTSWSQSCVFPGTLYQKSFPFHKNTFPLESLFVQVASTSWFLNFLHMAGVDQDDIKVD